jgi:hypothetical protein
MLSKKPKGLEWSVMAASGNGAMAFLFHVERRRRAEPEQHRSAKDY